MFRLIGITTVILLLSYGIFSIESFTGGNFIEEILFDNMLSIMATILGLQLATASFLLSSLSNFELRVGTSFFNEVRSEIKTNLYSLVFVFLLSVLFLVVNTEHMHNFFTVAKKISVIAILLFSIATFYEMVNAIFSFENGLSSKEE